MGIAIKELITSREIELKQLSGKIIMVDAPVILYQFLTTIRQADGSYLTDSKGNITSHLVGINSRISRLIQNNLRLAFVFDGKSPELKRQEQERRKSLKEDADMKYRAAAEEKDILQMKKFASRNVRITTEIIDETKELLSAFGIPWLVAPSEAEAQASFMVKCGDAYAVATQDTDALMFGCPRIVRNLSLIGRHKRQNRLEYQTYKPEIIELNDVLNSLGIDHEKLVLLSILVGTDFNHGGIKGIGPKNALKLVKEYRTKDSLKDALREKTLFDFDAVYDTIKNIQVTREYRLEWKPVDFDRVYNILVTRHDFSEERVKSGLKELLDYSRRMRQTSLAGFF